MNAALAQFSLWISQFYTRARHEPRNTVVEYVQNNAATVADQPVPRIPTAPIPIPPRNVLPPRNGLCRTASFSGAAARVYWTEYRDDELIDSDDEDVDSMARTTMGEREACDEE